MTIARCFAGGCRVPAALGLVALAIVSATQPSGAGNRLLVTSTAFSDGGLIPGVYASRGCAPSAQDRSPQLAWRGGPSDTKSYALTIFDRDAPTGQGFWHWIVFDIPPNVHEFDAGAALGSGKLRGIIVGRSDFGASAYGGPCPPPGDAPHHYLITVRALDVARISGTTSLTTGPQLVSATRGHVLAEGTLIGRFGR